MKSKPGGFVIDHFMEFMDAKLRNMIHAVLSELNNVPLSPGVAEMLIKQTYCALFVSSLYTFLSTLYSYITDHSSV
jgi:hypothetical protein